MAVSLDILDATQPLSELQTAIRQTEELGFRLLSLSTGFAGGTPASLVTFSQEGSAPPAVPITVEVVGDALSRNQQEAQLNGRGKPVVCYGSLYVQNQAQNVAAYR